MMPRRVRCAVLVALLFHGLLILTARYHTSFDAYTHMLFADHYAQGWWSLWDPRWYTGFEVVSYPPLTHQLIALFARPLGVDAAYGLVLWAVGGAYPAAIYAFSRVFTGRTAASFAALCAALFIPIFITAHVFGQLPHLTATLFALLGAAALARFLREGGALNLALSAALSTVTMAAHHATLLFQPFLILAVCIACLPGQGGWRRVLSRLILFLALAIPAGLLVIWPFWVWGAGQLMQTPIDHLSRHNFLADPYAQLIFFWPMYGPLVVLIPMLFFKRWPRRFLGLIFSFALLFVLGLGGTTPLPGWLFGKGWEWLTYDRFAYWASLMLTPFFGTVFILFRRRMGLRLAGQAGSGPQLRARFSTLFFYFLGSTALAAGLVPLVVPIQPHPIEMQPIVEFLNGEGRSDWRYLTFGFGDQFAYLNILTKATTIDGSYHTARTLPELRTSGIAQIDTAFWSIKGVAGIDPILQVSAERGVRWGFVARQEYIPILRRHGWRYLGLLSNGIQVWEDPRAQAPISAPPPVDPLAAFSWGVLPMLALVWAAALGGLRLWPFRTEAALRAAHAFLLGLLPLGLCLWYYRTIFPGNHPRVYFIYDHALFFLADGIVLLAVMLWLAVRIANPARQSPPELIRWMLALCTLATISILWARDWRVSLYLSAHLWVVLALVLSLRDWHEAWHAVLTGCCAALGLEIFVAFLQFGTQSTRLLSGLATEWPALLDASVRGASIVRLADGTSFLRAYGTTPHPNILGGFTLVLLLGPAGLFLLNERRSWPLLILFAGGVGTLVLTFSRSAWLGLAAAGLVLLWKSPHLDRKRLLILGTLIALAAALTILPLRQLVRERLSASGVPTEEFSTTARLWLTGQAIRMIGERPLSGLGMGGFVLALADRAGPGYIIEPVHSLPLLAASELGLPGLVLVLGLALIVARSLVKARRPEAILAGAVLAGLGVTALLDHYWWTLAPGRVLMGVVLGLWAGQLKQDEP